MNQGTVNSRLRDHNERDVRFHVTISVMQVTKNTTAATIRGKRDGNPSIDRATAEAVRSHHAQLQLLKKRRA